MHIPLWSLIPMMACTVLVILVLLVLLYWSVTTRRDFDRNE